MDDQLKKIIDDTKDPFVRLSLLGDDLKQMLHDMKVNWPKQDRERINKYLKEGGVYLSDEDVLMQGEKAIWFPKGNALEWQLARGKITQEFYDLNKELQNVVKNARSSEENALLDHIDFLANQGLESEFDSKEYFDKIKYKIEKYRESIKIRDEIMEE